MQFSLFRPNQKLHHHILSGILVSLALTNIAFGIDSLLAASENSSKKYMLKVVKLGGGTVQSINQGGIDCGKQCRSYIEKNSSITLVAKPENGFTFQGWGNPECRKAERKSNTQTGKTLMLGLPKNTCTLVMNSHSKTITAVFEKIITKNKNTLSQTGSITVSGELRVRACPMDAKMCTNGNYIGRSGPQCEFICPETKKSLKRTLSGESIRGKYVPTEK